MKRKQENESKLRDVYNYINESKIVSQNVTWDSKNLKSDKNRTYNQQMEGFKIQKENF